MKNLVIANWKMNPQTLKEAKQLFSSVKKRIKNIKDIEVVICPPFVYLPILGASAFAKGYGGLAFGSQDCFWEEKGAFTGEISPKMLKNLGCQYVIIGHSERRKLGETDETINKKIKAVITAKLKPILCIGETEKERKAGKTFKVLKTQIKKNLNNLTIKQFNNLILAYEPVWAIGTGNPCSSKEAKKVFLFLQKLFGKVPVLYGGSVNSENARDYIEKAKFQGLLVGGASLNTKEFIEIVRIVSKH